MFYGKSNSFFFFSFRKKRKLYFINFFFLFSISIPFNSPHSHPDSQHSHPYSLHSHPDSEHSHHDSLHSHPHSPYFNLNSHIPRNPNIPTPVLRIPTLIPRVPTLISCVPIIPLIPFSDSPFQLLQIAWNLSLFLIFIESSFPGEKNGNGKVHFVILGANWNLPLYKKVWKIWLSEYF